MASHSRDDLFVNRGQLDRFARALAQAIYDRTLEQSYEIKFYYDADVVVWMVLGFRQFDSYFKRPSPQMLLMRALLSAGYLGTASLLRPHALELDSLIRRQPSFESGHSGDGFVRRVRDFLKAEGIERHIAKLLEIVHGKQSDDEKIDLFLHDLQDIGAETFSAIELAHGSWQERLKRLYGPVLSFDDLEERMDFVPHDQQVWFFTKLISGERVDKRRSMSNFRDAVALSMLSRRIRDYEDGKTKILARFHTDTESVKRAWKRNSEMRKALTYKDLSGPTLAWDEGFSYRGLDYFIVRASFEALCFQGLEAQRREGSAAVSLNDLQKVSLELTDALRDASYEGLKRIDELRIGEKFLREVIWELESLSFIRSVWAQYRPPDAFRKMILGLGEVWAFSEDRATRERIKSEIRREITRLHDQLGEKVAGFRSWQELLRRVQAKADRLRGQLKPHEVPDPMRDLGLIRWNSELSEDSVRRLQEIVEGMISPDEDVWSEACAAVASLAEAVEDVESCTTACSILWGLSLFDDVVGTINVFEDIVNEQLPPSLIVLRTAARLRSKYSFSRTEKRRHIESLIRLKELTTGVARGRLLLGLGYVTYYAWYAERHQSTGVESGQSLDAGESPIEWARMSLQVGEEAVSLLSNDRLGWAFAVNHCAYVGEMCRIEPDKTNYYLGLLREVRGDEDIWHYRFADTIAYGDYILAKNLWFKDSEEGSRGKNVLRQRCCSMLRDAQKVLVESGPYFGDPEIPQHKLEIDALIKTIGCPE